VCDGSWSDVASRTFLLRTVSPTADRKWRFSRERRNYSLSVGWTCSIWHLFSTHLFLLVPIFAFLPLRKRLLLASMILVTFDLELWPWQLFLYVLHMKVAYNLKTTDQILVEFWRLMYLSRLCKWYKSGHIWPWRFTLEHRNSFGRMSGHVDDCLHLCQSPIDGQAQLEIISILVIFSWFFLSTNTLLILIHLHLLSCSPLRCWSSKLETFSVMCINIFHRRWKMQCILCCIW